MSRHKRFGKRARQLYRALILLCTLALVMAVVAFYFLSGPEEKEEAGSDLQDSELVTDGIHQPTGLIAAEGYREVIAHCTACHSASLVTQNRMDAAGWKATIRWMQQTQNLWELGDKEAVIIDYLVTNYPVEKKGRRAPLKDIGWYRLDE